MDFPSISLVPSLNFLCFLSENVRPVKKKLPALAETRLIGKGSKKVGRGKGAFGMKPAKIKIYDTQNRHIHTDDPLLARAIPFRL
jgi:hypothetical protein